MKCPNCGNEVARRRGRLPDACPVCGQELPHRRHSGARHTVISVLIWIACIAIIFVLLYKAYYWIADYRLVRQYTRGAYTPTVSVISMEDGRVGHCITYYGNDGDQIFLSELGYSTIIAGGTARFEFADSDWFQNMDIADIDGAEIAFTPILLSQDGSQKRLPILETYIAVPESPFIISSPAEDRVTVFTSAYNLAGWVVPGSAVSINGEDVTSYVDRAGNLSLDVRVRPIDDNVYTFLVKTPNHHETRYDVTIYRQALSIEIELDESVSVTSSSANMTVSGYAEPGTSIVVDTPHVEDSLYFDMNTGEFSFIAQFETIGSNVVRFHASKEGRDDAMVSFSVYYVPARAQYINTAWKMDYQQLRTLFEQWKGRIFCCKGEIVGRFTEDGKEYLVMNVGTDTEQLIVLTNSSNTSDLMVGHKYTIYADVSGRMMYNTVYYPYLMARYVDSLIE